MIKPSLTKQKQNLTTKQTLSNVAIVFQSKLELVCGFVCENTNEIEQTQLNQTKL